MLLGLCHAALAGAACTLPGQADLDRLTSTLGEVPAIPDAAARGASDLLARLGQLLRI